MDLLRTSESGGVVSSSQRIDPLINAEQLSHILNSEDLVVLDLGPDIESYNEGHVPGAVYIDWVDDITDTENRDSYQIAGRETFQALLRSVGITENSRIVIYDDMDSRVALRMYWSLKYYGLTNLQVLDGGRDSWLYGGYEMSEEIPMPAESDFSIQIPSEKITADLDFIADRLQNPKVALIDGRPKSEFSGQDPGKVFHTGAIHENRGHIPGAINVFWQDNFNDDGTFKSIAELEELYSDVTGSEWVVTYCNEGLHAVPAWFVLSELLGRGNIRVYDSSMSEWANSSQPIETNRPN